MVNLKGEASLANIFAFRFGCLVNELRRATVLLPAGILYYSVVDEQTGKVTAIYILGNPVVIWLVLGAVVVGTVSIFGAFVVEEMRIRAVVRTLVNSAISFTVLSIVLRQRCIPFHRKLRVDE